MSAITLFGNPFLTAVDADGLPIVSAAFTFFEAGTTTPLPVYTEPTLMTAWAQPILTNAAGISDGPVYLTPTPAVRVVAVDSNAVPLNGYPVDFISPAAVAT